MIRKIFLSAALLLSSLAVQAFDWEPKDNTELYNDMVSFTYGFIDQVKGTKAEKILVKFIQDQETTFEYNQFAWINNTYRVVESLEKIYPPVIDDNSPEALIRRNILKLVDYPIHCNVTDKAADNRDEQNEWIAGRDSYRAGAIRKACKWLNQPAPKPGELAVFKVYNMGFIFRTSERCFGVDLCFAGTESEAEKFAKKLDCLFITHPHRDHYTPIILRAMLEQGKTLFLPNDIAPDVEGGKTIISWDDIVEPVDVCGIKVRTFKGNQNRQEPEKMPNNVYSLSFDGWVVNHSGDNSDKEREARLCEFPTPDLAIAASWNKIKRTMDAVKNTKDYDWSKVLFIPSHENEFGHRVQQRESYWEDFNRNDRYADPEYEYLRFELMDIGEGILLKK